MRKSSVNRDVGNKANETTHTMCKVAQTIRNFKLAKSSQKNFKSTFYDS